MSCITLSDPVSAASLTLTVDFSKTPVLSGDVLTVIAIPDTVLLLYEVAKIFATVPFSVALALRNSCKIFLILLTGPSPVNIH